jgi:predicted acylesterase/phospholipase RssA
VVAKGKAAGRVREPPLPKNGATVKFSQVYASELAAINARQRWLARQYPDFPPRISGEEKTGEQDRRVIEAVGLSLSGGGIRSAAFCLGVLQGLDSVLRNPATGEKRKAEPSLLERVDYLSTVSGGGYVGCSLTAAMSNANGEFPFKSELDQDETDSIKHIRDYSNYLFPKGFFDFLDSIAIYLRGLIANFVIMLPIILGLAVFTILCSPTEKDLDKTRFHSWLVNLIPIEGVGGFLRCESFGFTWLLFFIAAILFLAWGIASIVDRVSDFPIWKRISAVLDLLRARWKAFRTWQSGILETHVPWLQRDSFLPRLLKRVLIVNPSRPTRTKETGSPWARVGGIVLFVLALFAFCEAQPWILGKLFSNFNSHKVDINTPALAPLASASQGGWIKVLGAILTSIGVIVSFFSDKLEKLTKNFAPAASWSGWIARYGGKALVYVASAAIPLVLWGLYLTICLWGIASNKFEAAVLNGGPGYAAPEWLQRLAATAFPDLAKEAAPLPGWLEWLVGLPGVAQCAAALSWLATLVKNHGAPIAGVYVIFGVILLLLSIIPTLNANSLHRLYRDRLSTAFIFFYARARPAPPAWFATIVSKVLAGAPVAQPEYKLHLLDEMKLSELSARLAPYHIINAALNIQGSTFANQRARNADFFTFSRNYVGSEATDYVATPQIETIATDLNLATAMAVSGAAASPNMGSGTIRSLTPTLTLLNIRLAYWMRNPRSAVGYSANRVVAWIAEAANWYFIKEMFGRLHERMHNVYLTDGGHIENLGIYELLKRRCRLIIAVDAEADPQMNFPSFIALQRHARIDLGVRIDMPWQPIRNASFAVDKLMANNTPPVATATNVGPHSALGIIQYPNGEIGYLLYVKSSLSGDENDYIIDYKRRNPTFPHETTGDQLFTEEQFEAYRALGFHASHRALNGKDKISVLTRLGGAPRMLSWTSTARGTPLAKVRAALRS